MSSNTTAPMTGANTEATPPVTVSMRKLVAGVGTVFAGVIQMLEALDPQAAAHVAGVALQNIEASENTCTEAGKEEMDATEEPAAAADTPVEPVPAVSADDADLPDQPAEVKEDGQVEESQTTPGVTLDDITKIIVGKIKQNPGNNEKMSLFVLCL